MNDEFETRSDERRRPFPGLRFHKPSRRFLVEFGCRRHYWPSGTTRAVAQADYDAMRAAYESGAPVVFPGAERAPVRTVDALIDAYLAHCDRYYANSKATVANIERALTPLHERFGRRPLDTFGPKLLRDVREGMLVTGWSREVINARVQNIVRMFKWAVAEELVPSSSTSPCARSKACAWAGRRRRRDPGAARFPGSMSSRCCRTSRRRWRPCSSCRPRAVPVPARSCRCAWPTSTAAARCGRSGRGATRRSTSGRCG